MYLSTVQIAKLLFAFSSPCAGVQHPDSPAVVHLQCGVCVHLLQRGQKGSEKEHLGLRQLLHHLHRGHQRPQLLQVLQSPSPLEHCGTGGSKYKKNK